MDRLRMPEAECLRSYFIGSTLCKPANNDNDSGCVLEEGSWDESMDSGLLTFY